MVLIFAIKKLDINQSYFFGKVQIKDNEYKVNIQNEKRGKVLKLPFGLIPKKDRVIVRLTGAKDIFVEDFLPFCGESEWLEIDSDEITYFLADHQDKLDMIEIMDD